MQFGVPEYCLTGPESLVEDVRVDGVRVYSEERRAKSEEALPGAFQHGGFTDRGVREAEERLLGSVERRADSVERSAEDRVRLCIGGRDYDLSREQYENLLRVGVANSECRSSNSKPVLVPDGKGVVDGRRGWFSWGRAGLARISNAEFRMPKWLLKIRNWAFGIRHWTGGAL